jgi:DNA-binding CsgD family transcriptional regulator
VTASERGQPEGAKGAEGAERGDDDRSPGSWRSVGDRALIAAIRRRRPEAVEELIRRFEAVVLRYASWLRVPRHERTQWAKAVLYEVALTLGRGRGSAPDHLAGYIVAACKRTERRAQTAARSYQARVDGALDEVGSSGQLAALGVCSEDSVRLACGVDWEPARLSPVLERLTAALDAGLTAEERDVLSWLGQHVSYTTIAEWLGISRPAAVSRIQRLRTRLIGATLRFAASLGADDLAELLRFLDRAGVRYGRVAERRPTRQRVPAEITITTTTREDDPDDQS